MNMYDLIMRHVWSRYQSLYQHIMTGNNATTKQPDT